MVTSALNRDIKKIVIVGGSIAGCINAILLERLGIDVKIFERSPQPLVARGVGIAMPEALVKQCMDLDLFDRDIPFVATTHRSFYIKNETREIWEQPFAVCTLHWGDIYENLRRRVPDRCFHSGVEVRDISELTDCDLVVAADGVNSALRKQTFPDLSPSYAGYVAWRGVNTIPEFVNQKIFEKRAAYFVFSGGHLLVYRIPAADFRKTGRMLLNWLLYEQYPAAEMKQLQTHKPDISHLHALAKSVLPSEIADIILKTEAPFVQPIYDLIVPNYLNKNICFVADAAAIARPHSASGVLKALADGLSLSKYLKESTLDLWNKTQLSNAHEQLMLSQKMGDALVTKSPDWDLMNPELMNQWWQSVMSGQSWYATPQLRSRL